MLSFRQRGVLPSFHFSMYLLLYKFLYKAAQMKHGEVSGLEESCAFVVSGRHAVPMVMVFILW